MSLDIIFFGHGMTWENGSYRHGRVLIRDRAYLFGVNQCIFKVTSDISDEILYFSFVPILNAHE